MQRFLRLFRPKTRILDPNKRYLFSRPRGGLNDALVQIEKVRNYAIKYNRTLILDLRASGLRLPFETVFVANDGFGCELIPWSKDIAIEMDQIKSVFPPEIARKVSRTKIRWHSKLQLHTIRNTDVIVDFDHESDQDFQLLVHQQCGGGEQSLNVLEYLSFRPWIADKIAERLMPLGNDYDAIHVRHSDYKTDFETLFAENKDKFKNRSLLICSDSKLVKSTAKKMFHPSTHIVSVSDIPNTNGQPLHLSRELNPFDSAVDLFSDLVALSRCRTLLYSKLSSEGGNKITVSGFSRLAENLKNRPDIIRNLFRFVSDAQRETLFPTGSGEDSAS